MMPVCLHGGWFMGTSCMACDVLTVWHNCVRPLVRLSHCHRYATSPVAEGGLRGGSRVVAVQGAKCDRCVAWCAIGPISLRWAEVCNNPSFSRGSGACSD